MKEYVVETNNLCCRSGNRYLVQDITWQVEKGQHWCVFGLNGCGKTTLLSMIAGYKTVSSGNVKVLGETFCNENILAQRKRIGWVSSSFFDRYFQKEAALDIVLSGKTGHLGLDFSVEDQDVKKAKQLLAEFGLEDKMRRPFSTMSKGERQNVLLARALLTSPEILILDEPCSGLDVLAREKVLQLVEYLATQSKMTLIYVTHYFEEILPVFERSLLLRDGKIFAGGLTHELFTSECLSDFFNYKVSVQSVMGNRKVLCPWHTGGGLA